MSAVAEFPGRIYDIFLTDEHNAAGIYGIRFFIRGKPWVVDIDDGTLWDSSVAPGDHLPAGSVFSYPFAANADMWGVILEKAWGKVKGSMASSASGGYHATGLRSLVGAPHFEYRVEESNIDEYF